MQRNFGFWVLWAVAIVSMSGCGLSAKKRDGLVLGALAGALAGGGAGAGIGPEASDNEGEGRAAGIAIGAAAGAIIGGLIGYALAEEEAPPPPPPLPPLAPPAPDPAPDPVPAPNPCQGLVLPGVMFDFDQADIRPEFDPVLNTLARRLGECADISLTVEGHTDSRGSEDYNQTLSERRAEAVAGYLEARGVDAGRLEAVGMGESAPVELNQNPDGSDNPDGRAKNRRVVLSPR